MDLFALFILFEMSHFKMKFEKQAYRKESSERGMRITPTKCEDRVALKVDDLRLKE